MSETLNSSIDTFFIRKERKFLCFKYAVYFLRPSTVHLIHLITKINPVYLQSVTIHDNLIPLPKRYGGITWGRRADKAHISLRKSYFNHEDLSMRDITVLSEILVHESCHIKQISKYRFLWFGLIPYIFAHAYNYIKARSHDLSPLESEPIQKQHEFIRFNAYVNKTSAPYMIAKILSDESLSEKDKIKQINILYNEYTKRKMQRTR